MRAREKRGWGARVHAASAAYHAGEAVSAGACQDSGCRRASALSLLPPCNPTPLQVADEETIKDLFVREGCTMQVRGRAGGWGERE